MRRVLSAVATVALTVPAVAQQPERKLISLDPGFAQLIDPAVLEMDVRAVVAAEGAKAGVRTELRGSQSLRPGRPVPTHRYAAAVN